MASYKRHNQSVESEHLHCAYLQCASDSDNNLISQCMAIRRDGRIYPSHEIKTACVSVGKTEANASEWDCNCLGRTKKCAVNCINHGSYDRRR